MNQITASGLSPSLDANTNLDARFALIHQINPLSSNGAELEDAILQMLRREINDH